MFIIELLILSIGKVYKIKELYELKKVMLF
jgi:hypothetical protein